MSSHVLSVKTGAGASWGHDASAALFSDGVLAFGAEEERFNRIKHGGERFPEGAVRACLDYADLRLSDLDTVVLTSEPELTFKRLRPMVEHHLQDRQQSWIRRAYSLKERLEKMTKLRLFQADQLQARLERIDQTELTASIKTRPHHHCHAASAFYPSGFDDAAVLTIDGRGEYDATVAWAGTPDGLERVRTYRYPNSLGSFFAVITSFLGYQPNNGEGKVMGLAPYGNPNSSIEQGLREFVRTGVEYDTTALTTGPDHVGVRRLEDRFNRSRHSRGEPFSDWEKDLAYVAQSLLEETVVELVDHFTQQLNTGNVCLAGGVALNCKVNKCVREATSVENLFVQPVAHDGGLPVGAGMLERRPEGVDMWSSGSIYLGPQYKTNTVEEMLGQNKIGYERPDNLEQVIASELADGQLVGWFQGRMEMGPRALGNRSILADPRTIESRDRVNKYVKHREEWRPFAPSLHAGAAETYLVDATDAPYMIQTFDVHPERRDEIPAVVHHRDGTTRPQTVTEEGNPRYYQLIDEFAKLTGVPVLLNTSFNDHGEPIVNTPQEALVDFYRMGLDTLVVDDCVVRK